MNNKSTKELFAAFLPEKKADTLFANFNGLRTIARASNDEFLEVGLNKQEIKQVRAVLELGLKYAQPKAKIKKVFNAGDAYQLLAPLMQHLDQEVVRSILLDERHTVIDVPLITVGVLNSCLVDPRELFKEAVRRNAYALIIAHQHPSGDPKPSSDDITLTKRAVDAGEILGVNVIDHIIIGSKNNYFSFNQANLIKK